MQWGSEGKEAGFSLPLLTGELQCGSLLLWAHFHAFRPNPEAVSWLSGFQALKLHHHPSSKKLVDRGTSHSSQHGSCQSLSASVSHIQILASIFSYPETTNNSYSNSLPGSCCLLLLSQPELLCPSSSSVTYPLILALLTYPFCQLLDWIETLISCFFPWTHDFSSYTWTHGFSSSSMT